MWGGAWYRTLWEKAVQVGERQEAAEQAQTEAATMAVSSSQKLQDHSEAAAEVAQPSAASSAAVATAAASPVLLPYTSHSSQQASGSGAEGAAAAAVGAPPAVGMVAWDLREVDTDSAAALTHDAVSVADSAMTLEDLRERETAASLVSSHGYLSPGSISAVSSTTGGVPLPQHRQQQVVQVQQQQRPQQQQLRRQDSASMQGPFGDEPEQHVLWHEQQQQQQDPAVLLQQSVAVDNDDVDSDTLLLHRGLGRGGGGALAGAVQAVTGAAAGSAAAGGEVAALGSVPSITLSAGSAVPAAERGATGRAQQLQPLLGQDSDMLLARAAPSSSSSRGLAGAVSSSQAAAVVPGRLEEQQQQQSAAVLAVEPRMDSARELVQGSVLLPHPAAGSAAEGLAGTGVLLGGSGSGRLVRVDSALDTTSLQETEPQVQTSPPYLAAAAAAGPGTGSAGAGVLQGASGSGRLVRADSALDTTRLDGPVPPVQTAPSNSRSRSSSPTAVTARPGPGLGSDGFPSASAAAAAAVGSSRHSGGFSRGDPGSPQLGQTLLADRTSLEANPLLLEARRVVLGLQGDAVGAGSSSVPMQAGPSSALGLTGSGLQTQLGSGAGVDIAVEDEGSGCLYPDDVELYTFADSLHDEDTLAAARRVVLGGAGSSGIGRSSSGPSSSHTGQGAAAGFGSSSRSSSLEVRTRPMAGSSSLQAARREYVLDSPRERSSLYDLD